MNKNSLEWEVMVFEGIDIPNSIISEGYVAEKSIREFRTYNQIQLPEGMSNALYDERFKREGHLMDNLYGVSRVQIISDAKNKLILELQNQFHEEFNSSDYISPLTEFNDDDRMFVSLNFPFIECNAGYFECRNQDQILFEDHRSVSDKERNKWEKGLGYQVDLTVQGILYIKRDSNN